MTRRSATKRASTMAFMVRLPDGIISISEPSIFKTKARSNFLKSRGVKKPWRWFYRRGCRLVTVVITEIS